MAVAAWAFSLVSESRGCSLVAVGGLLIVVASFSYSEAQAVGTRASVVVAKGLSS